MGERGVETIDIRGSLAKSDTDLKALKDQTLLIQKERVGIAFEEVKYNAKVRRLQALLDRSGACIWAGKCLRGKFSSLKACLMMLWIEPVINQLFSAR